MKPILFVVGLLCAAVAATPKSRQERFVEGIIAGEIEKISEQIREDGLDPLEYSDAVDLRVPVTDLMILTAHVEKFIMVGLSDLVINRVDFSLLSLVVNFDIGIPRLSFNVDSAAIDAAFFGYRMNADVTGSFHVVNARATGEATIVIIPAISIRTLTVDFTIQAIQSNLRFNYFGEDLSDDLNYMISNTVHDIIAANYGDINKVMEYYLLDVLP